MNEEINSESLRDFLNFMQGLYEDRIIADAEISLALAGTTPSSTPMPNTYHPAFTHVEDFIRNHDSQTVAIASPASRSLRDFGENTYPTPKDLVKKTILTRKKCTAPAPFVGDPRMLMGIYVWPAWIDDLGRHVCGDSKLVIGPR